VSPLAEARAAATRAATAVVVDEASDTTAALVAGTVAWMVRPRRSADALRRAVRDAATEDDAVPGSRRGAATRPLPTVPVERLAALVVATVDAADLRAAADVVQRWARLGCRAAPVGTPGYPPRLAEGWPATDGPPLVVWRGAAHPPGPAVAVVGARRASGYGTGVASWLAEAAAAAGVRVVSGGAVGVDAAAHRAAVGSPGRTTVVLGCGHDVPYPRPHAEPGGLFSAIVDAGGTLLSELLPSARPVAGLVRARNRIVAGLADVTVVVEGGARSGALLTAGAAAERGRAVLAVPGDVRAPGSVAPHRLLGEGAAPCTAPADLLAALPPVHVSSAVTVAPGPGGSHATAAPATVSTLPAPLLEQLRTAWPRPVRIDTLAASSGLPAAKVLAAITRARVAGELAEGPDGVRLRRAPSAPVTPDRPR
jgi:DNA processing protein